MSAALPASDDAADGLAQERAVICVEEHGDIAVKADLIFLSERLDIYPEVQNSGYLRVKLAKDTIVLQAGGLIGYVPLNSRLALDIRTRVPVSSLERLVALSGVPTPPPLPFLKAYASIAADVSPVLDIVASQFCSLIERLEFEGLFKTYERVRHVSGSPSGRIFSFETAMRTAIAQKPLAAFERFERTTDNPPNQIILHAIRYLAEIYRKASQRAGVAQIRSKLARSENLFSKVSHRAGQSFQNAPYIENIGQHTEFRPALRQLVLISQFLLRGHGVAFRGKGEDIELPSIVLRMDKVFEGYLLNILRSGLPPSPQFSVLDGNANGPMGGEGRLFDVPASGFDNPATNPDIVVRKGAATACVMDAKYKVCDGAPQREDLNQVICYALAHETKKAILIYPSSQGVQKTQVVPLGSIRGIDVYKATISLGASDLSVEETAFSQCVLDALG